MGTSHQTGRPPGLSPHRAWEALILPATLIVAVFAMRWPFLGHPMIHVDEQFYLVAGQRLVDGWVPYADFWDRKPVGLFLVYGAIRLLGGDGILAYQIVASAFVAATSLVVYLIARRAAPAPAAFAAALIYCALLAPINGAGGQAPIFYNLPMALSALLILRAGDARDAAGYWRKGVWAMACAGVALQIKYLAAIEGALFGLWLVFESRRYAPGVPAAMALAAVFATVALVPALAATAWFAAAGAFDPFLKANFISIFERGAAPAWFEREALWHTLRMLFPALLCAGAGLALAWLRGPREDRIFLTAWLVFAAAGFMAIGNFYDHYALPLVLPLSILLSRLFAVRFAGPLAFGLLFLQTTVYGLYRYSPTEEGRALTAAMTAQIRPVAASGECLFVADAPLVLYLTTGACAPWRYSFPFHLLDATEAGTGDRDQPGAMRAILAARPGAIVTGSPSFTPTVQRDNAALLERTLASGYVATGRYPDRGRAYTIWIRRDLVARSAPRLGE